jgi:hypothetical protein
MQESINDKDKLTLDSKLKMAHLKVGTGCLNQTGRIDDGESKNLAP